MKDLVVRDGLYYKKFSNVPFSGKLTGLEQGTLKNGKLDGSYANYYDNGQLRETGNYKNGKQDGAWVSYWSNGQLVLNVNYKNGEMEDGSFVSYHMNGKLNSKGNFKNGRKEGVWVSYNDDGTVYKYLTGTYKNGKMISD